MAKHATAADRTKASVCARRSLQGRRGVLVALILAWGLMLPGAGSAAEASEDTLVQATDFRADGREAAARQIPILLLFTSPGCHYCERAKREYLVPMQHDPAYRKRVIIREVSVGNVTPLTDFDGSITTESAYAAAHKVFVTPTVKVLDPRGRSTGDAIVGLLIADYYFGYLESAIDQGLAKTRTP